jgi:uncharacterized damage-inducible protein DinB
MHKALRFPVLAIGVVLAVTPLLAADGAGYRDEALKRIATLEKKFVGLAEAMPAGKYTWRPAEGVRSVSEVFLHVAAANYGAPRMFGTPPPAGFNMRGFDKSTTDKAEVVSKLRDSFAHLRGAVEKLSDNSADQQVKMYGQQVTMRAAVWNTLEHLSEHLGQSIAYARMNGVVPPWSK